jgi:predicted ArsR family transcriptional regulator
MARGPAGTGDSRERDYRMVGALDDPLRRRLFDVVSLAPRPVSRDEVAKQAGVGRGQAAFHLDRLVEVGLLEPVFRRLTGRTGPGAGRPAKLYRRSAARVRVTIPERRYQLLAGLLVSAVAGGSDDRTVGRAGEAAASLARSEGRSLLATSRADPSRPRSELLIQALDAYGFMPAEQPDGSLVLRNCPFEEVAATNRDVVCTVNLAFQRGLLDGLEGRDLVADLTPGPDRCCVVLRPSGGH